jgi:molybdate transport system regulatory protein
MAAAKSRQSSPATEAKPGRRALPAAVLYLRVDFGEHGALGPGKTRLMELIAETGSISAAGRAMGMSYRRAWLLVDALNVAFGEPLVAKQTGGSGGGGAMLTKLGREVVQRYRRLERRAASAGRADLEALTAALAIVPTCHPGRSATARRAGTQEPGK